MKLFIVLSFATAAIAQPSSSTTSAGSGTPGGAVTGQPYSAEQITEHIQTLVDGTRITKTPDKTTLYRDSQGRTRIERRMLPGPRAAAAGEPGLTFIEIDDPASGSRYTLDPRLHTARKTPIPRPLPLKNPANSLTD